jgi:hypothetical protein
MMTSELLALPHLSLVSRGHDPDLHEIVGRIEHTRLVGSRHELESIVGELLACATAPAPKTLDLIGHSTADKALLVLGDWVIDAASSTVTSFFRGLADHDVFARLGITAIRLLGCLTADTGHGRSTICTLADITGVEVYGTRDLVCARHYEPSGFAHERRYLLVGARELGQAGSDPRAIDAADPYERVLDLDALPASPLEGKAASWPLRIASRAEASALLRLVRRRSGASMPGLLTAPCCEVAIPSAEPDRYHRAQILLAGEMIRVFPDGLARPGIVYAVDDATALMLLVDNLPPATQRRSPAN